MKKADVAQWLRKQGACQSAQAWFLIKLGTVEEIYNSCPSPDWFEWLYGELGLTNTVAQKALIENALLEYEKVEKAAWGAFLVIDRRDKEARLLGISVYQASIDKSWDAYASTFPLDWKIVNPLLEKAIKGNQ